MIPAAFDYVRVGTVAEAVEVLATDDAKLLAGGHSLLPLMKLRMATPRLVVDIGRIADLSYVREVDDHVAIGALTRHRDLEVSEVARREVPALSAIAGQVGDPQVRHRGTIGGSVAHGDPASDLPAAVLALDGTIVAEGPSGRREIPATQFFTGFLETALAPDEVLCEIRVPKTSPGWSFQKLNRRAQDWAIVGAVAVTVDDGDGARTRVGLVNMGSRPLRATAVEEALAGGSGVLEAAERADEGAEPPSDLNASAEFRRHLARVLVRRCLEEARA